MRHLLIDGKLVGARGGGRYVNINPATEEAIGEAPHATLADIDEAITSARRAFDTTNWSLDKEERKKCLKQLQVAIEGEREAFRDDLVAEVGTPIQLTYGAQLDLPIAHALRVPTNLIDDFDWECERSPVLNPTGPVRRRVLREPVGVVGVIVPWNFPFEILLSKIGPILATGNTCVVKPAMDTPDHALRLARLINEQTEIPRGVVNIVTSSHDFTGERIAASPQVDMVAFTGSTKIGRRVMEVASRNLTRVFLELGGKSPAIVLDDVPLESVLQRSTQACLHAGQGCSLATRLLLPQSRYDEAVHILREVWSEIPYGDPTDPVNICGPLINSRQRERVMGYIESGRAEGARLLVGGGRPTHLPSGYFVEPTLFVDVEPGMKIAQEEIFGPVMSVILYGDDEDAIRIANDCEFGLAGSVYGEDDDRAEAVARRIRSGMVSVNGAGSYDCTMPFGGYRHSGIGRQWGVEGFAEFLEIKSLSTPGQRP